MRIIGITGGVGCGKSAVLSFMQKEYHAAASEMDETARALEQSGTACFARIVEAFGEEIVGADGELDRAALASLVFVDPQKMRTLNGIVHPAVLRRTKADIAKKREGGCALYLIEAALLPDAGRELCDELWYIYASEDVRRKRLAVSRNYTDEKITQILAAQLSEEEFREACDAVIDNSGDWEETKRQIQNCMPALPAGHFEIMSTKFS